MSNESFTLNSLMYIICKRIVYVLSVSTLIIYILIIFISLLIYVDTEF